jgi:hypothetical protein
MGKRSLSRRIKQSKVVELNTNLNLIPNFRAHGVVPPLLHVPYHCDALIKPSEILKLLILLNLKAQTDAQAVLSLWNSGVLSNVF